MKSSGEFLGHLRSSIPRLMFKNMKNTAAGPSTLKAMKGFTLGKNFNTSGTVSWAPNMCQLWEIRAQLPLGWLHTVSKQNSPLPGFHKAPSLGSRRRFLLDSIFSYYLVSPQNTIIRKMKYMILEVFQTS